MHILHKLGEARDVAVAARWLLGEEAWWVTGQVIGVDGGLGAVQPRPQA